MSDDFIDKEEQNEENIPTPENGHLDYKPADTKNTGVKHQLSGSPQSSVPPSAAPSLQLGH